MFNKETDSTIKLKQNVYSPDKAVKENNSALHRLYNTKSIQFAIRHLFVVLSFIIPFLIMLIVFIKAGMHPAGDNQILVIDCWHQYFPFISEMQDKLQNGGSLLYSLRSGWGQNFLGIMSYYTASPLNFLALLIPEAYIRDFLALFVCIKIGCAGLFMGMFLKNVFKRNDFSIVLFSIPYALCAYLMGYYWNIMWLDTVALMPLVALGVHYLIKDGKFKLYTISLAVAFFSNFYIGFFLCIFIALFFIAEVICSKYGIKTILKRLWQVLLFSVTGIALTAILILPAYLALKATYSGGNTSFPSQINFYKDFRDVLANLLAFRTPSNIEGLPNLYCSLLAVIMIGVHALSKKIPIREKIVVLVFLTFLIVSCNNNILDFIWHGFHFTNQIPFRFSFIFAFVLIIVAYRAFTQLDHVSWFHIAGAIAAAAGIIVIGYFSKDANKNLLINNISLALAYLALITVLLIKFKFINTKTISIIMIIPMVVETYACASKGVDKVGSSAYSTYYASNDEVQELLLKTKPANDDFYRTEMSKWYTINDPCLYRYYGISQFSSMSDVSVSNYMENIGIVSQPGGNRYYYGATNPFTNALLNLKYVISKTGANSDTYLKEIDREGASELYENTAYLPFGFMVDSGMKDFKLSNPNNPFYYLNALFKSMTGIDKDLYSYVLMTNSTGENATVTNEDNATGVYNYVPGNPNGKILYSGELALNNSENKVDGVDTNSYYQLKIEDLKAALNLSKDDEITNELDGKKLHVTFRYQSDADLWADGADFYFYAPSDPEDISVVDETFAADEPYEFSIDITDAIKESGLAIEGFGAILTEVSIMNEDQEYEPAEQTSDKNKTAVLKFNYTAMSDAMLYCFFDSDVIEDIETKISSDDQSYTYTVEKDLEYIFPVGYAKKGETATVMGTTKEPLDENGQLNCLVYQINDDVLQEGLNKLKSNGTYDIIKHTDTYFKGDINAATDGYMYTAIPSNGWSAYVDGKKAETTDLCGAVLGIKLEKGKHTIELKYTPPGFIAGIIISISGLAVLIFMSIFVKKRKPKCFEPSFIYEKERRKKKEEKKALKAQLSKEANDESETDKTEPKSQETEVLNISEPDNNIQDETVILSDDSNIAQDDNFDTKLSDDISIYDSDDNKIELKSPELEYDPNENQQ